MRILKAYAAVIALVLFGVSSASAQITATQTTLSASAGAGATSVSVASATNVRASYVLFVDAEAMLIMSVTGTDVGVRRAYLGTALGSHASGANVYVGPSTMYVNTDPAASVCDATLQPFTVQINPTNGRIWSCVASVWTIINNSAGGSGYVSGAGVPLGPIFFLAGTGAAPSVTFNGDTGTGMYRLGANNPAFSANGAYVWDYSASAISSSAPFTFITTAIGTTSTDGTVVKNTTNATVGTQVQYSPRVRFEGAGWKTNATAASQKVDVIQELRPVAGTAAPSGLFAVAASINGGAYSDIMTLTTGGVLTVTSCVGCSAGLVVGTTAVASGSSGNVLYNNAGVLGEMTTTGSGTVLALATSPVFVTPTIGVATATSLNKIVFTAPATGSTFTLIDGKTFTVNKTISLNAGDDTGVYTLPTGTKTLLATDGVGTSLTGIPYTLTGTTSQVNLTAGTGNITFSLPQSIATTSTPRFAGLGIGMAPTELIDGTANTNGFIGPQFQNTNNGASAATVYRAYNSSSNVFLYGVTSAAFTAGGAYPVQGGFILTDAPGGIRLNASNAAGIIAMWVNGSERGRMSATGGFSVGTTTDPGAGNVLASGTASALNHPVAAPTISSGFGTSPVIDAGYPTSFIVTIGTGGTASTGVVGLPTAAVGWVCQVENLDNPVPTTSLTAASAYSTSSVTLTNYTIATGVALAWPAGNHLRVSCFPH